MPTGTDKRGAPQAGNCKIDISTKIINYFENSKIIKTINWLVGTYLSKQI